MKKIVHLSNTPLVGAPGKLSYLCEKNGYLSHSIILGDYPEKSGLNEKFMKYSILWNKKIPYLTDQLLSYIEEADIIHIHNDFNIFHDITWKSNQKFIYHVHSPLREGPIFIDKTNSFGVNFSKKLVVGQYHPRHYPDFYPVPNIVLGAPSKNLVKDDEPLRVMYSPTHKRGGRWNNKFSEELNTVISSLEKMKSIKIIKLDSPLPQDTLLEVRKTCHVSIDEISTGAYHQISLEGLCAGNVVINNADYFSSFMLASLATAPEMPPFYRCNPSNISKNMIALLANYDLVRDYQKKSFDFFDQYLRADKLFEIYNKIYLEILTDV